MTQSSITCDDARDRLADGVGDADLATHLAGCAGCRAIAAALREVDGELRTLAPIDPPDALVEATLARVAREDVRAEEVAAGDAVLAASGDVVLSNAQEAGRSEDVVPPAPSDDERTKLAPKTPVEVGGGSFVAASLAVIVAALTALFMAPLVLVRAIGGWLTRPRDPGAGPAGAGLAPSDAHARTMPEGITGPKRRRTPWLEVAMVTGVAGVVGVMGWQRYGNMVKGRISGSSTTLDMMPTEESESSGYRSSEGWFEDDTVAAPDAVFEPMARTPAPVAPAAPSTGSWAENGRFERGGDGLFAQVTEQETATATTRERETYNGLEEDEDGLSDLAQIDVATDQPNDEGERDVRRGPMGGLEQGLEGRDFDRHGARGEGDRSGDVRLGQGQTPIVPELRGLLRAPDVDGETHEGMPEAEPTTAPAAPDTAYEANLDRRRLATLGPLGAPAGHDDTRESLAWHRAQATTGLTIRPRDGWWQSTYVPGDPALRLLHARLAASSTPLAGVGRTGLAFAEDADAIVPVLEAPRDRALAVGAFADTAAIDGPTRVRVEVALRSVAQASGRRGVMRVAVVVDADLALDADAQARTRAIVNGLSRSSSSRDQLALYASGPSGGRLAALGPMRAGRFEVALRHLFAGEAPASATSTHSTTTSPSPGASASPVPMSRAVTDALEAVSGADGVGLVLVLTPDAANDAETERAIHLGTVAGITTSAIGVGHGATVAGLDAIALAGQGRRRIVLSDDDAVRSVRAELSAASELVARAVRVRVRLAEGVDLIDVIGSRPLDAEESARTRRVERSIDQDLARRLGIVSDRDEDDDGIRMLLPAFYANDAHTIVLDLLVRQPGRVLDVDVSSKDLVRVGNARASASLTLPSGRAEAGPRELRVRGDALAHESARALTRVADALAVHDLGTARVILAESRALLASAAAASPGLARLPSFVSDRARLEACASAIEQPSADRSLLADAMRLAAHRRLLRPRLAVSE